MPDATPEETRRKFREALDRKNARTGTGVDHKDRGSKVHSTSGPAGQGKMFRRKSV